MTTVRDMPDTSESERELREQSLVYLQDLGDQLASERTRAQSSGRKMPIAFVVSSGVEQFPAETAEEGGGVVVLATAFIPYSNPEPQLERLFAVIRQQVENA